MKMLNKIICCAGLFLTGTFSVYGSGTQFDLIPHWGIRVTYQGLSWSDIAVKTQDGSAIVNNEIPIGLNSEIRVEKPAGFQDSAGFAVYRTELSVYTADEGRKLVRQTVMPGKTNGADLASKYLSLNFISAPEDKPGSKYRLVARILDAKGNGEITLQMDITLIAAAKKIPLKFVSYSKKDSKGMRSASVGLHFNAFEFKGVSGNNFLYKLKKGDKFEVTLKGLEGWKAVEGKAEPSGSMELLDAEGNLIETVEDCLAGTMGHSMQISTKEITIRQKLTKPLETGKAYFAWIKLRDGANARNTLDVVVKFYAE